MKRLRRRDLLAVFEAAKEAVSADREHVLGGGHGPYCKGCRRVWPCDFERLRRALHEAEGNADA